MKDGFDNAGEQEVGNYLRNLPELAAPPGLISRTMKALEQPAPSPWHARPWITWPAPLRILSLVLSFGALAAMVLPWNTLRPALAAAVRPSLAHWSAEAGFLREAFAALAGAAMLAVAQLGKGFALGLCVLALLSYSACVGLGAMILRFASVKPNKGLL